VPDWAWEDRLRADGHRVIAGVDEVGRGPWAGPIVAAAVVLPPGFSLPGLDDSKRLSPARREALCAALERVPGIRIHRVAIEAADIDREGLGPANRRAMAEALRGLGPGVDAALVDGHGFRSFPVPHLGLVGGDALSLSVAAASVVAKVWRDRIMDGHAVTFPQYGFEKHKGYGTRYHQEQLALHGPCPIHRRSFRPVAAFALPPHPDRPGRTDRPNGQG
jgi:ribonuclease HII